MVQEIATVTGRNEVADGVHVVRFSSAYISRTSLPGQFVNVRVGKGFQPLLRRPFSVCRTQDDEVEIVFNVIGEGTRIFSEKEPGEKIDVLGPLGTPFGFEKGFDTALMVAGGLGVAPFPLLTQKIRNQVERIETFVGAGTGRKLWTEHLENVHTATDDGTKGFRGTVVAQLEEFLTSNKVHHPKIFGCGPTRMLHALSDLAKRYEIACDLSLEGDMACGLGICQGCPVERVNSTKKYSLVCTDGPTFDSREIVLQA